MRIRKEEVRRIFNAEQRLRSNSEANATTASGAKRRFARKKRANLAERKQIRRVKAQINPWWPR